jgi:dCTP deaminase
MTILDLATIRNDCWLKEHPEIFTPFVDHQIKEVDGQRVISYGLSSVGYDIRLDGEFKFYLAEVLDPKEPMSAETVFTDCFELSPHGFVLAKSFEWIKVPADSFGICFGKSTYARVGLICNVTPLEPGWEGYLTIELSNTTDHPIRLYVMEGIAQIVFLDAGNPSVTYDQRNGKYMNQTEVTLPKV